MKILSGSSEWPKYCFYDFLGVSVSTDVISAYGLLKSTNDIVANETQKCSLS